MLSLEEKAACLAKGVFAKIDEAARLALAARMGEREMEDGQILFLQGKPGSEVYVVVSGEVKIVRNNRVIALLGPGELIGDMAVLGVGNRTASGYTCGPTRLLFLAEKALRMLIQQTPVISFAIFEVLIDRLTAANDFAIFLTSERKELGEVRVLSGDIAGSRVPIFQERSVLGRSRGALLADGLRLALPSRNPGLLDRHLEILLTPDGVYVEPLDGAVEVGGERIDAAVRIEPDDPVEAGGLTLTVAAVPSR
ncbi:MAG: cyclic nucleotide-binding domain-containing protein [Planctomycetota bacterium]